MYCRASLMVEWDCYCICFWSTSFSSCASFPPMQLPYLNGTHTAACILDCGE